MKKSKKTPDNTPAVGIKFKITNLRTAAYPGPLEKSDYFGYVLGDLLVKGSQNTIYQIVHMQREGITDLEYAKWMAKIGSTFYKKISDLIEEYKKNAKFGACYIHVRPVFRSGKQIVKGKVVKFNEIDSIPPLNHRDNYGLIKVSDLVKNKTYTVNSLQRQVDKMQAKLDLQKGILKGLQDFDKKMNPEPAKIEVIQMNPILVHSGTIADTLVDQDTTW